MSEDKKNLKNLKNAAEFNTYIDQGLTFIDFWAPWCGPCRMVAPIIEQLSDELDGKVKFGKLDTDENPEVAGQYGIQGIPTFILFKDGKPIDRIVGAANKMVFSDFVNKHLN